MAMEVDLDFSNEKNDFLNRKDMAIGFIFLSISLEILHKVYVLLGKTPHGLAN